MSAVRAPVVGVRIALAEAGLIATGAATVFALVMILVRLEGTDLTRGVMACLLLMGGTWLARSRGFAEWSGMVSAITTGTVLGFAAALVGAESQLLFLPVLFVLLTIASMAPRRNVLVASLLAALGYVGAAAIASVDDPVRGRVLLVVAVGVVVLPMVGSLIMGRMAASAVERARLAAASDRRDARPSVRRRPLPGLTPRQSEVVDLVAQGMRHAEIAERLDVSVNQVRRHLQQARERTGTSTTRELVAQAVGSERNGATAPDSL